MNENRRAAGLSLVILMLAGLVATGEDAQDSPATVYKSSHFLLHTDLPAREAHATLARMESVLRFASRYWRRSPRGQVDCYLVDNLKIWPDTALPHPLARVWIGGIGGATICDLADAEKGSPRKVTVYASARAGIIEHEVIHAYCAQTFSELGPEWYKEGMAEVASRGVRGSRGVVCSAERIRLLKEGVPKTVQQIVKGSSFTRGMSHSLGEMLRNRKDAKKHVPLSDWSPRAVNELRTAERSYAWSWAFCHILTNNSSYSGRFRALGSSYLDGRDDSFARAFSSVNSELEFELAFFARHVDVGYRVDLCRWDWHKRFGSIDNRKTCAASVVAARGFQPSGFNVDAGQRYGYLANGKWSTSKGSQRTGADGGPGGQGRLVGVVMKDFRLSAPFDLGAQGAFVAPTSGKLFLRCKDAWNKLADNQGKVLVEFTP